MRGKWLTTLGACAFLAFFMGSSVYAQHNPSGKILGSGMSHMFPLLRSTGSDPGSERMKTERWLGATDLRDVTVNPKAGDVLDISGGPTYAAAALTGGDAIVFDVALLTGAFGTLDLDPVADGVQAPNWGPLAGEGIDFDNAAQVLNNIKRIQAPGTPTIPWDNAYSVSWTYIDVTNAGFYRLCGGSDDSLMIFVNNQLVSANSIPRGSADCQDDVRVWLPEGESKITMLVFEGGGGWNLRMQLYTENEDGTRGTLLRDDDPATTDVDESGGVTFLGPAGAGQEQFAVDYRKVSGGDAPDAVNPAVVTITGSGPGDGAVTVTDIVSAPVAADLVITGDGVTTEDLTNPILIPITGATFSTVPGSCAGATANGAGFVQDTLLLGPMLGGGSAPGAAVLEGVQIQSTTNAAIDETLASYHPAAGDTVPDNVQGVQLTNCANCATLNPGDVLTWNLKTGDANLDFNTDYYGGDVDNCIMAMAFYLCLDAEKEVVFGVGSDDAYTIRVDGAIVGTGDFARGAGGDNEIQNTHRATLSAGEHFVLYKVYEGGGGHGGRIGVFEDALDVTAKRVTIATDYDTLRGDGASYSIAYPGNGTVSMSNGKITDSPIPETRTNDFTATVDFFQDNSGVVGAFDNSRDVGGPAVRGSTDFDGLAYTVTGQGGDIWANADQFQFAYKKVSGDFTVTARIIDRIDPVAGSRWGKHGLMARNGTYTNSKYSIVQTHLATTNSFGEVDAPVHAHRRVDRFGDTREDHYLDDRSIPGWPDTGDAYVDRRPAWMKLRRMGSVVYSYLSYADEAGEPIHWAMLGSDNDYARPDELLVGLAVNSHSGSPGTVVFDSVEFEGPVATDGKDTAPVGEAIAELNFEAPEDIGVAVTAGGFTPAIVDGKLRILEDGIASQANAVWYGVPYDSSVEVGGVPLTDTGLVVDFDLFTSKGAGGCDADADPNPGDGMGFAVIATSANDALASALAPPPAGLEVTTLRGDAGGGEGYQGNAIQWRTENHPSFMVEFDNWNDGPDAPQNRKGQFGEGTGSPQRDCGYHVGVNINGRIDSIQNNAKFGVADGDLPDLYDAAGVHATVLYQPDGRIDVWLAQNAGGGDPLHVLSTRIPALPAGDLVLGFTGGTGGATLRADVDNVVVSVPCREVTDSVTIECPADGSLDNENQIVSATVEGADGEVTYAWTVTGGSIVGPDDGASVEIDTLPGTVTVSVTVGDGVCSDGATAECSFTVEAAGVAMIPGNMNLDAALDISDPVSMLNFLFAGIPLPGCLIQDDGAGGVEITPFGLILGDWNGDASFNISDPVGALNYLFAGGGNPPHVLGVGCQLIVGETTCESTCVIEP